MNNREKEYCIRLNAGQLAGSSSSVQITGNQDGRRNLMNLIENGIAENADS